MTTAEAVRIINEIAVDHDTGVLETLEYMRDNLDDFEPEEVRAYRTFMTAGRAMFA
jgi:hypothetical protein